MSATGDELREAAGGSAAQTTTPPVVDYANPLHSRDNPLRQSRRETTPGGQAVLAAVAGTFYVSLPVTMPYGREVPFCLFYGWLLWGVGLLTWAVAARDRSTAAVAGPTGWRRVVVALFVASLLVGVKFDRCPHATYVHAGPIPLTFGDSTTGATTPALSAG